MRCLAVLGFVCLVAEPAAAMSCDQVRYYVDTYGASAVIAYAKKIGASSSQIREGRACLRRAVIETSREKTTDIVER